MAQINKGTLRIGEESLNYQGDLMRIVNYNNANDIIVEFQDKNKARVHTNYYNYKQKSVKNPYYPEVCGVGMVGNKYTVRLPHGNPIKEYYAWRGILRRCFDEKNSTYKDVTCCEDWLYYENFYEWLHSQDNFEQWLKGDDWAIDKDILIKGNKRYSFDSCCLVPRNINNLFIKCQNKRGEYPIGVGKHYNKFNAKIQNPFTHKTEHLGYYSTSEEAFQVYKQTKESYIKQVAQEEYGKGNITKQCYDAMMNYEVEIID